jgi:D-inositol-3-phosphate glycosyltransferase
MLSVHTCPLAMLGGKYTGGMNVYVRDLSKELCRRGIAVDIYTRAQNLCSSHDDLGSGCRVIHVEAGPPEPLSTRDTHQYMPQFVSEVQRLVAAEEKRYDLVHAHYWLSGLVGMELRSAWGRPLVQMFHTLGELKNQVAQSDQERETPERIIAERRIMATAERLIAASPVGKLQMVNLYGADPCRIEVIPPGVDLELFYPRDSSQAKEQLGLCPNQHVVLFVGRIEPLKGIDTLLRAMAVATDEIPNWRDELCVAIIGGDASVSSQSLDLEMGRLQELRTELGIEDLVTFLGSREQHRLPDYYSAADVVVMPSHYESFGLVALEAMACATPVVASRVGGLAYTVRDGITGLHVPERDPDALAREIIRLVREPDLRERLGQQAYQVAQCYGWRSIADRLLDVYGEVARHDPPC